MEYAPDGKVIPSLACAWKIAPDNTSVTLTLRKDVKFHSGTPFNAEAVAATLKKASDPQKGKNVYATMSFIRDWTVVDDTTITLNFTGPAPERQITDLLQFLVLSIPRALTRLKPSLPERVPIFSVSASLGSVSDSGQSALLAKKGADLPRSGLYDLQRGCSCNGRFGIGRRRHHLRRFRPECRTAERQRVPSHPRSRAAR